MNTIFKELENSIMNRNLANTKELLLANPEILHTQDSSGFNYGDQALILALKFNYAEIVRVILNCGVNNPYLNIRSPHLLYSYFKGIDNITVWTVTGRKHYALDPHRHVKIWLSKDPDIFMSDENQLRLVTMRSWCPGDDIHLIYDSSLLSKVSQENILKFSNMHNIVLVDVRDIMLKDTHSIAEKALLEIYEDEITNLGIGGNLGAASDILRVLRAVFSLGVYSDLDVTVKTRHLPPTIEVFGDILISAGSYYSCLGREKLYLNNDIFAVVDPTSNKIPVLQENIIAACRKRTLKQYFDAFYPAASLYLEPEISNTLLTPLEFRSTLSLVVESVRNKKLLIGDIDKPALIDLELTLYMRSVIRTTGPKSLIVLFKQQDLTSRDIDNDVAPYTLASYPELCNSFKSTQHCALHVSNKSFVYNTNKKSGDLSWTNLGEHRVNAREQDLHINARKIQRTWLQSNAKPAAQVDSAYPIATTMAKT